MLNGRVVIDFFAGITTWVMWAGVVVGILAAVAAGIALVMRVSSFAPFAAWAGGMLAASTGIALGTWAPMLVVASVGGVAYAVGTRWSEIEERWRRSPERTADVA